MYIDNNVHNLKNNISTFLIPFSYLNVFKLKISYYFIDIYILSKSTDIDRSHFIYFDYKPTFLIFDLYNIQSYMPFC